MNKLDQMINQALSDEDQALLARHGEPAYLSQVQQLFRGPWNWAMWLVNVAVFLAFLGGAYCFWRTLGATDVLVAVQWATSAILLFQVTVLGKSFLGSHLQANRLLREIKRMELQLSLLRTEPR